MMMQMCGPGMMIAGILAAILGLGQSQALVWVLIARLWRDSRPSGDPR
jgi:hypothetical protein